MNFYFCRYIGLVIRCGPNQLTERSGKFCDPQLLKEFDNNDDDDDDDDEAYIFSTILSLTGTASHFLIHKLYQSKRNSTRTYDRYDLDVRNAGGLDSVQVPDHDAGVHRRPRGDEVAARMHSQRVAGRSVQIQRVQLPSAVTSKRQTLQ